MGFFESDVATGSRSNRRLPVDMLHRQGCSLCPLDRVRINSPKMEPSGSEEPEVYCLGEAPGADEDKRGEPFVGRSGRLLRAHVPRKFTELLRYSNIINCWPGEGNPDPTEVQVECCRGRVVGDIERSQPRIILGFGNHALAWATGQSRIMQWRGRRLPIKVGNYTCWFYPMLHPSYILHKQDDNGWGDDEQLFAWDMAHAFSELEHLPEPIVHNATIARQDIGCVMGGEPGALRKVYEWLQFAGKAKRSGVDYETNRKRPYAEGAKVLSAAVSVGDECLAFAFDHREASWSAHDREQLGVLWTEFLMSECTKVSHFAGFELEWSGVMFGRETVHASDWEDTATQAATLDERVGHHQDGPLSLAWLTLQHFGLNIKKLSRLDRKDLDSEPLGSVLLYNGIDSRYHDRLFVAQHKLLKQQNLLARYEMMRQRLPTVVLTQMKGVWIDPDATAELQERYGNELDEIDYSISQMPEVQTFEKKTGEKFNPGSPKQVGKLIRDVFNIYNLDSADEAALKQIDHPFSPAIIRHRKLTKRKSNYVDAYTEHFIDHEGKRQQGYLYPDGSLHPNLNTLFARTGRSSADEPNVQNVIKHDEEGKEVRKQIKARLDHVLVSVDQGQIQFRNIAMESRDPVLCKMLWEDYDVHTEWAERLSRRYPDVVGGKKNFTDTDIMGKFRQTTKNKFVFPACFGAQVESMSGPLGIPVEYLEREFKEFWRIFTGIGEWHEKVYRQYRENGYVKSLAGGYHRAPLNKNKQINSQIQDDEAIILFNGFNRLSRLDEWLLQANMEIHDDLVFEWPVKYVGEGTEKVVTEMLHCPYDWINVPLMVEVSVGTDWLHMHEEWKVRSDKWLGTPIRAREYL